MNMKIASFPFVAAILCCTLMSLAAQTNAPAEDETNQTVAVADDAQASNAIAAAENNSDSNNVPTGGHHFTRTTTHTKSLSLGIHMDGSGDNEKDAAVNIAAILGVCGMPVAIMAITFYAIHRRNKLMHDNLRAMIEKGMPITPELVNSMRCDPASVFNRLLPAGARPGVKPSRTRHLLPALVFIGVGAALMTTQHWFGGPGLIVFFIGIAFLIVWLVERMDKDNRQSPKP